MNKIKILFITILSFCLLFVSNVAYASSIDITTSSVRDDLASMGMDKLSYLSDTKTIFITMSQYYDNDENLRSYLYFNYTGTKNDDLSVSISTSVMDENYNISEDYKYYDLSYINNDYTWYKFEILNLPNLNDTTRRYNILDLLVDDFTFLNVGQTFIYNGITNNSIKVFHQEIETITITEKEVHFYCYGNDDEWASFWGLDDYMGYEDIYNDAWYIFFNTDKEIDDLLEIELTYTQYDYTTQRMGKVKMDYAFTEEELLNYSSSSSNIFNENTSITKYYEPIITTIYPGTTKIESIDKGWFGKYDTTYETLDNIMDLREYKNNIGDKFVFTEQADKYTWGVHFLDTQKSAKFQGESVMGTGVDTSIVTGSGVKDTAILRLKFEVNGEIKNCYAVDVPTSDFDGGAVDSDDELNIKELFEKIMAAILLVLLLIVLNLVFPIGNILVKVLSFIVECIYTLITLPFRLIGKLFKRRKY